GGGRLLRLVDPADGRAAGGHLSMRPRAPFRGACDSQRCAGWLTVRAVAAARSAHSSVSEARNGRVCRSRQRTAAPTNQRENRCQRLSGSSAEYRSWHWRRWGVRGRSTQDGQLQPGWVRRVVEHVEVAAPAGGRGGERLAGAEVAGEARERAAGDLQPQPVPGADAVSGREQLDVHGGPAVVP